MRIRAERDDLADVLSRAARAVGTRSPLPILQGLLCEVRGTRLEVTGTDLEVTVRTASDVEVLEEGRTVMPARLAADAVSKLPSGAVTLQAREGEVVITGSGPKFRLRELLVDDFPAVGDEVKEGSIDFDGELFIKAVSQVGVAASNDEARPILTGVFFEAEETGLRLVATDSYRLAVRDLPGTEPPETGLVPFRALRELNRTIASPKVGVAIGDRQAAFRSERGSLTVRVIEGSFPNYRQLLPESHPNRLTVPKTGFEEAVARAALVGEDHIPVRLSMQSGGVELSTSRQDVGGETEMLEGDYQGEDLSIAFNIRYLNDGISVIDDDEIVIETAEPGKPGLIHGSADTSFRYLLMPVRL